MPPPIIALVAADLTQRSVLEHELRREGFEVSAHASGGSLRAACRLILPDAFVLDAGAPEAGDPSLAQWVARSHPRTARVLLSRGGPPAGVSHGLWDGPFGSISPVEPGPGLPAAIRGTVESSRLARRVRRLEREVAGRAWGELVGRSTALRDLADELDRLAASEVTVRLHGEAGTGKGHVARSLHRESARRGGALFMKDCEEHRGGAGSSADTTVAGDPGSVRAWSEVLEEARGGTLFLGRVDRLRPEGQETLLRAVREWGSDPPVGSGETGVDFRLVVGSREPLQYAVGRGAFRQDLFDRLRGVEVRVPALRERVEDVPRLVEHFVRAEAPDRLPPKLGREAADRLLSYTWPGNVRELRQAVRRALATCEEEIGVADLPADIRRGTLPAGSPPGDGPGPLPPDTLELRTLERWAIRRALVVCEGNLTEAAARLGMGRTTLYRKLGAYGLR